MKSPCSTTALESALAGKLPPDDEGSLHRHLEECEQCGAALERMAGGPAWRQEVASLLTEDDLDGDIPTRDDWSAIDFIVEYLEPADNPSMLGRLGGYDVLEVIGHGGMGVVLKAFDRELKRCVAIKVLAPHLAQSSLAKKRFAREAQAAAAVVHPHVLAIHQVQPSGRLPFLVMPLVAGESLAERLSARGTLELKEILRIGMQAAAGLAAAHEQGLVHRDVKPANILLEKGVERAVLTDFGLARAADDVALTRWGIIAGTPQYMSPEQARGEPLDGRSDLFSLGCVLYEMATGVSPFRADSTMATMRRLVDDAPQAMDSLNSELPSWFIAIVDRLLEKDPSRRFGSAKEVSELLEGCLAHVQRPASAPLPAGLPKRSRRRARRPIVPLVARVLGAIALLAFGLWGFMLLSAEPPDISGEWSGEEWGRVTLKKTGDAAYTGAYSDTIGEQPGEIQLKWSRIERRFNGIWREGEDRFGELSVRVVGDEIRGALTTDPKSKINPATPRLADLAWIRADGPATNIIRYRGNSPWSSIPPRMMFQVHVTDRVAALAYSPDGKLLAISGERATVALHDAKTGKQVSTLELFNDDEEAILADERVAAVVHDMTVRALAFSPDASVLAVGHGIGQVKLFDVRTGALLRSLDDVDRKADNDKPLHRFLDLRLAQGNIRAVAFSPDGSLLATCGEAIDYALDGVHRLGHGPTAGLLKLWDAKTGELKWDLKGEHNSQVLDVAFSPNGRFLASAGHWYFADTPPGSGVKLWDPHTGKVVKTSAIPNGHLGGGSPLSIAFSPDGKRMAVGIMLYDKGADVTSGSIQVLSPASGILELNWLVPRAVRPLAFSPDGKTIAALSGKNALTLWDSSTGEPRHEIRPTEQSEGGEWECFAIAPQGGILAVGGIDAEKRGVVTAWKLAGDSGDVRDSLLRP